MVATDQERITLAQGSGGEETEALIRQVFASRFSNVYLDKMEDAAALPGAERLALTTDSFVVEPLEFPGGDIGKLAICGTVNDLLMRGAVPKYLTCGFILEAGTKIAQLERIVASMAECAAEAGILLVAGDTKVVENAHPEGGILINTTGVGFLKKDVEITPRRLEAGDVLLLSGALGDHHGAILSHRMKIQNQIQSDVSLLTEPVSILLGAGLEIHAMRDVTRGGLATVLNEFAKSAGLGILLQEDEIPVHDSVRDLCGMLGLDPFVMGNEGKFVAAVAKKDAEEALKLLRGTMVGAEAAIIGEVSEISDHPQVILHTRIGGRRVLTPLMGEGLPRIC